MRLQKAKYQIEVCNRYQKNEIPKRNWNRDCNRNRNLIPFQKLKSKFVDLIKIEIQNWSRFQKLKRENQIDLEKQIEIQNDNQFQRGVREIEIDWSKTEPSATKKTNLNRKSETRIRIGNQKTKSESEIRIVTQSESEIWNRLFEQKIECDQESKNTLRNRKSKLKRTRWTLLWYQFVKQIEN